MTKDEDLVCGRSFQFLPDAFLPFGIFGLSFRISPAIYEFGVVTGIELPVMIVVVVGAFGSGENEVDFCMLG